MNREQAIILMLGGKKVTNKEIKKGGEKAYIRYNNEMKGKVEEYIFVANYPDDEGDTYEDYPDSYLWSDPDDDSWEVWKEPKKIVKKKLKQFVNIYKNTGPGSLHDTRERAEIWGKYIEGYITTLEINLEWEGEE